MHSVSYQLLTRLLPGFISPERSISKYAPRLSLLTYLIIRAYLLWTRVQTWRQIIIYRNGISINESPLLCKIQLSENRPKPFTNLPIVSRKVPKKYFCNPLTLTCLLPKNYKCRMPGSGGDSKFFIQSMCKYLGFTVL